MCPLGNSRVISKWSRNVIVVEFQSFVSFAFLLPTLIFLIDFISDNRMMKVVFKRTLAH